MGKVGPTLESVNYEAALKSLPHGPEFRFVDRVLELQPGVSGVAEYTVRPDAYFLRGHFPGQPMMPGVLMIEALAQVAGIVAQSDPQIGSLPNLKLTAIRAAKILGAAFPGDRLVIEANINGRLGGLIQASATIRITDKVIVDAELTLAGDAPNR